MRSFLFLPFIAQCGFDNWSTSIARSSSRAQTDIDANERETERKRKRKKRERTAQSVGGYVVQGNVEQLGSVSGGNGGSMNGIFRFLLILKIIDEWREVNNSDTWISVQKQRCSCDSSI